MEPGPLQYEKWVEEALRSVIHRSLTLAATTGLPGDHHFFITFNTTDTGVDIPGHLSAQHPDDMTIVMQHQFTDLVVDDDGFAVSLVFNGKPSRLIIPFAAVTAFADPAVNFGLQLKMPDDNEDADNDSGTISFDGPPASAAGIVHTDESGEDGKASDNTKMGEIIALDAFRKE